MGIFKPNKNNDLANLCDYCITQAAINVAPSA